MTHDEAEAEDILHDAWLSVGRAGRQDDQRYLLASIRNRFVDLKRREHIVVMGTLSEEDAAAWPDPKYSSEEVLIGHVALERALAQLRPVEREVLYLHCVEGYTQREVAEFIECPLGTVSSMVARAMRRIRALCADDELESSR